ncbi:MAG: hypothetical protein A2806_01945 [Candidatus Terrybacteria bacterium RIFCSPHIGHO2_01_FULL_48_17]|uniref:Secondary thiamine-phosphate synthase enzyme n=1 Tax=Candidatus Terrybacteria bacterium RIFCSPHIGHO2_01_FULL_48_17 TaxID=1802362 RepID=A0A1G2PL47_9BACT|nr:MAG: hypothetical protein A2806_01945 [Candidatus Terrybacteria bacterium RIFCSPHIGHO2_01_FULL_48_17]OHA52639.1 MAG: hypothetical protein A3A30_03350 [Candidatus Terrybacteria bacterium RIFCSPLOWO2_01_FULL_48_14]
MRNTSESQLLVHTTKEKEIVDITDTLEELLPKKTIRGVAHLFLLHTTAALTTADLDPGTDLDLLDGFERLVPEVAWRHPHDPSHMPNHFLSALIGTSLNVPFENGKFMLGTWQRIVLVEFSGPRTRKVVYSFISPTL